MLTFPLCSLLSLLCILIPYPLPIQLIFAFRFTSEALHEGKCSFNKFAPPLNRGGPSFPSCEVEARGPLTETEWSRFITIANKHAPEFWFHKEERYMPEDPDAFVRGSSLSQTGYSLKSPGSRFGATGGLAKVKLYADIIMRENVMTVRYYPFFAYTGSSSLDMHLKVSYAELVLKKAIDLDPVGAHEGGWEPVEVHIDAIADSVIGVTLWDHSRVIGGDERANRAPHFIPKHNLEFEGGKVQLYFALNSHTVYPKPGTFLLLGAGQDCDFDREYIGSSLSDYTQRGTKWSAASNAIFPYSLPEASRPKWLQFQGRWGSAGDGSEPGLGKCSKRGKAQHMAELRHKLTKSIPYVNPVARERLLTNYVGWVCRHLAKRFVRAADPSMGPFSPLTIPSIQFVNAMQKSQCNVGAIGGGERKSLAVILKEEIAADQAFKVAQDEAKSRQQVVAKLEQDLIIAKRTLQAAQTKASAAEVAVGKAAATVNSAHAQVAARRNQVMSTREAVKRLNMFPSASPQAQAQKAKMGKEAMTAQAALNAAERELRTLQQQQKNSVASSKQARADVLRTRKQVSQLEHKLNQARMAKDSALHDFDMASFARTKLQAMTRAAQKAEKLVKEATANNKKQLAEILAKKGPLRAKALQDWEVATKTALEKRAKEASSADIQKQKALVLQAKKRADKTTARFKKVLAAQTAIATSSSNHQKEFANAEAEIKQLTKQLADENKKLTDQVKNKDKNAKMTRKKIGTLSLKLNAAEKKREVTQDMLLKARESMNEVSGRVAKARAKKLKANEELKHIEETLMDLMGTNIVQRVGALRGAHSKVLKRQHDEEDKGERIAAKSRLNAVIAAIRTAQDAEVAGVEKLVKQIHDAKVNKFMTGIRVADAKAAVTRAEGEANIARQAVTPVETKLTTLQQQVKADQKRRTESQSAVKQSEHRLMAQKAKMTGLMETNRRNLIELSRLPRASPRAAEVKKSADKTNGEIATARSTIRQEEGMLMKLKQNDAKLAQSIANTNALIAQLQVKRQRLKTMESNAAEKLKLAQNNLLAAKVEEMKALSGSDHVEKVLLPQLTKLA